MKVLHISSSDKKGGAAIAAYRLHKAMCQSGIESSYLVLDRTINDDETIFTVPQFVFYIKRLINKLFEHITVKNMKHHIGGFSSFIYGINIIKYKEVINADIIYLHWVCDSFINYHILEKILRLGKPVFWFMHDMFPITGGCHHSFDCNFYYDGCYNCQYSKSHFSIASWQYKKKQKIYKQYDNLFFISPSKWLCHCAQNGKATKNKHIYYIPNLIDPLRFKPLGIPGRNIARQLFLVNNNVKVIGFGADTALTNPYKGWSYLKEALQILFNNNQLENMNIEVIIFGSNYNRVIADSIPFISHFLGHLHDTYSLALLYNCMDVFIVPSLADNLPNTVIESLFCNAPVVAFNVGGIPDMVNSETGYLAEYKNSNDLVAGISLMLKSRPDNIHNFIKPFSPANVLECHKKAWKAENII
jgi:glycosyltransferase involved in cell wall biosynthesis